jgi:hypothetical protein
MPRHPLSIMLSGAFPGGMLILLSKVGVAWSSTENLLGAGTPLRKKKETWTGGSRGSIIASCLASLDFWLEAHALRRDAEVLVMH